MSQSRSLQASCLHIKPYLGLPYRSNSWPRRCPFVLAGCMDAPSPSPKLGSADWLRMLPRRMPTMVLAGVVVGMLTRGEVDACEMLGSRLPRCGLLACDSWQYRESQAMIFLAPVPLHLDAASGSTHPCTMLAVASQPAFRVHDLHHILYV